MLNCRAEISDILHNAPSWGDQAFFWAKCASKLEAGNVREALEYAEVSLSWLLQLLPAKTLGMLGLDWIANHLMTQERTEGARQQALRLYRNISAADREAVEEGMQELQLILYQFWSDVSMLSTAFDTAQAKWQQERLVQPQQQEQGQQWQLKWAGPLAEGTEENEIQAPPASHHQGAADVQQVYFVTDRTPNKKLAGGFGNTQQSDVTYGVAMVNIPRDRKADMSASALQGGPRLMGKDQSMQELMQELKVDGELVLFVHGYNVTFKGAVASAGQLTFDTSRDAPRSRTALAFDWACCKQDPLGGYIEDLKRSENASSKLLALLEDFAQLEGLLSKATGQGGTTDGITTGAAATGAAFELGPSGISIGRNWNRTQPQHSPHSLHIVAHSMGHRVLQRALAPGPEHPMQARAIKVMESFSRCPHWSISFAAADARHPYFERMVTLLDTQSVLTKPKLTLYCSPLDWALWCSTLMRRISQTDTDGRAGYYRRRLMSRNHRYCVFVMQCLETVTVTGISSSWLCHSYFRDNAALLKDLGRIMRGTPLYERQLSPEIQGCSNCETRVGTLQTLGRDLPRCINLTP